MAAGGKTDIKLGVIFVCTGNTCRSPMAEFLFKAYLKDKKRTADFTVSSAGLYADRGTALSDNAHAALDALGVKHSAGRKARSFTALMAEDNDVIITMSERHAELCGDDESKIYSFEQLTGMPIADPFGGPVELYIKCAEQMRAAFDVILALCDDKLRQKRGGAI